MARPQPASASRSRASPGRLAALRGRFDEWGLRVELFLARGRVAGAMLFLVAVAYVYEYLKHPARPKDGAPGWWAWQDQAYYRSTAEAMAAFSADASQYKVSLGYPLLALPFESSINEHLFFLPNLAMALGIAVLFYRLGRLFLTRRDTVLMFVLVVWWTKAELVIALVIPWTSIPTHLVAYGMIFAYLAYKPSWRLVLLLTLLDGFAYLCRPGDGAFLSPLVVAAVIELPGSIQRKLRVAGGGIGLVVAFVVFDRLVNMAVFEQALSSYERGAIDDFFGFGIAQRTYSLLMDSIPIFRVNESMIGERLPYVFFAGPGAWLMARRLRWKAVAPFAAIGGGVLLYLSYDKFTPAAIYKYHTIHYVVWLFPLAGLGAYLTVRSAWAYAKPATFAACMGIPLALCMFVRLEEKPGPFVRVGSDGSLVALSAESAAEGEYDVLIATGASGRRPLVGGGGAKTEVFSGEGFQVMHFAEPLPPSRFRAGHPADVGATLQLRRLSWRLAPMPAWVERLAGGATVEPATLPVRAELGSSKIFTTAVGRIDKKGASLVTTGSPGMLQHGGAMELPHGRYVVEWSGVARAVGQIIVTVVDAQTGETLGRNVVELAPGVDSLLGAVDFRIHGGKAKIQPWLYVLDGAELELHRVQVWQYVDWQHMHEVAP